MLDKSRGGGDESSSGVISRGRTGGDPALGAEGSSQTPALVGEATAGQSFQAEQIILAGGSREVLAPLSMEISANPSEVDWRLDFE